METSYKNILVAVDGSKQAEKAFKKAIQIAKQNDAKLTIINVIDTRTFGSIEAYDATIANRASAYAEELLSDYQKEAEKEGLTDVDVMIKHGSPKVIISRHAAKQVDADLIVCGATGLNAVERFLIGSVSENIVRSANVDVLVVRSNEEEK